MRVKYYAGIGSRDTPSIALKAMAKISRELRSMGWVLRSGGSAGAEAAFEACAGTQKEIFGPRDLAITAAGHPEAPYWTIDLIKPHCYEFPFERMTSYSQALIARNAMQIVGVAGDSPVDLVICWTPTEDPTHPDAGGSRFACRLAKSLDIPTINLRSDGWSQILYDKTGIEIEEE